MRLASCYLWVYRLMSSITHHAGKVAAIATLVLVAGCGGKSDVDGHLVTLKPNTYDTIMAASDCDALIERHDRSADIVVRNLALAPEVGPALLPLLLDNLALRLAEVDATEARAKELVCTEFLYPQAQELKTDTCAELDRRHQQAADSFNESVATAVAESSDAIGC